MWTSRWWTGPNHHLFQPLLYQVAAGILPPGLIAPAIRAIIAKQANARAVLAEVHDIDLDRRVVSAGGPDGRLIELHYDSLVVAAGATHSYFGNDKFAEYAPGMKTVEDARYLRDAILTKFEMAEVATDPQERADWLTFVVIGAGPTGVELVGQIAELAHTVLPRGYRAVDTNEARIILLEGAGAVLPPFAPKLQEYTRKHLEQMGVEVRLRTLAVDMDHHSITVDGPDGRETIRTRTRVWAAGVQASPLARLLADKIGVEVDRAGRIPVQPDCTLPGHPEVFAIGDMVSLNKLAGSCAAGPAGRQVRREGAPRSDGGRAGAPAVPLLRQGLDGHDRLQRRGSRRVRDQGDRPSGLPHVGLHPHALPDRLGQPARHALHLVARAGIHQEPRAPNHHLRHDESRARRRAPALRSDPAASAERAGLSARNGRHRTAGTFQNIFTGRGTNVSTAQSAVSYSGLR